MPLPKRMFRFSSPRSLGEQPECMALSFTSKDGAAYTVERSADLEAWLEVDDGVPCAGATTTIVDTPEATSGSLYYRV